MSVHSPRFRRITTFSQHRLTRLSLAIGKVRLAVAIVLAVSAGLAVSSRIAWVQTLDAKAPAKSITVHAADKSSSLIHLKDGYELSARFGNDARANAAAQQGLGSPLSIASADFDEDGVPDIVTGYGSGKLALYRGNVDAIYPYSREAQQRKAAGQFTDEAFLPGAQVIDVPESPDVMQAGDFNADGHKDILIGARGSDHLILLAGDGHGDFSQPTSISLAGTINRTQGTTQSGLEAGTLQITALTAGEIGKADGQTDVAVAVNGSGGPRLLVYEHPEGAFKHQPEVFPLPAPATDIVFGDLDGDNYSDIAVASGSVLTIIHERGQAYPWDMMKGLDIQRPPAIVETRTLAFAIAGLAVGEFGNQRGNSLAMLSDDGSVSVLEPAAPKTSTAPKTSNRVLSAAANSQTVTPRFMPQDGIVNLTS